MFLRGIVERLPNDKHIPREFPGDLIEHVTGLSEMDCFGVESDEIRGQEIVKNCGRENWPGMELLGLAGKVVVCPMLDDVAVRCEVNPVTGTWQAGKKSSNSLAVAVVCF